MPENIGDGSITAPISTEENNNPTDEQREADAPEASTEEASPAELAIPDKFQNEDGTANLAAILKSNAELEKSFHAAKNPQPEPAAPTVDAKGKPQIDPGADLMQNLATWGQEIAEKGELTDETRALILKTHNITDSYLDSVIEGQKAIASNNAREVHDMVGGPKEFAKMLQWSERVLGADSTNAFLQQVHDAKLNGNEAHLKVTLDGLQAQFASANGKSWVPELTGLDAGGTKLKPFKNATEMGEIQSSAIYQSGDEAFQREFDQRMKLSMAAGTI